MIKTPPGLSAVKILLTAISHVFFVKADKTNTQLQTSIDPAGKVSRKFSFVIS